jgi:DNA-binding helix-hairpin-helix protein with protein kinase domain
MILWRASDGSRVRLGPELGRGGEGAVYEVIGHATDEPRVAKIYFKAPTPAKVEKLRAMARAATPSLLRVAAWPIDLLDDEHGRVRGFLMPRVAAREDAHELYSPRSRRRAFPDADFRFIVRAAANIARAFAQVHAAGHVIGDVNHGNALIGQDATVVLIDCDSFQIRDRAGRTYTCDVGVPLFTAPELQDTGFRGLRRSIRHDSFGLAVLLFHLLYLGRHPFAGRYVDGEMTIERAIAESRFAYGAGAASRGMSAPPATLSLDALGADIAVLFERAFAAPGDVQRPTAAEWIGALQGLEQRLTACAVSSTHFHPGSAPCCWCAIESRAGFRVFGAISLIEIVNEATLDSLWQAIKAVRNPTRDLQFPSAFSASSGMGQEMGLSALKIPKWLTGKPTVAPELQKPVLYGATFLTLVMVGFFGRAGIAIALVVTIMAAAAFAVFHNHRMRARAVRWARGNRELRAAEIAWKRTVARWEELCSSARFNREVLRLKNAQKELASLAHSARGKKRDPRRELEELAHEQYLDGFRIDRANLGLRPQDVAALSSFGFETAADVIAGSGQLSNMIRALKAKEILDWARALQASFRFKPSAPHDPALLAQIEQRHADRQRELLTALREGPTTLEQLRSEIEDTRAKMEPEMEEAMKKLRAAREAARAASQ